MEQIFGIINKKNMKIKTCLNIKIKLKYSYYKAPVVLLNHVNFQLKLEPAQKQEDEI